MKIWGVNIKDEIRDGKMYWHLDLKSPFQMADKKFRYGINERILQQAQDVGVYEFKIGEKSIRVPSKKTLKQKIKAKEFEDHESMFGGTFKIYYFSI
jgi:hypothetical protein